METAGTWMLWRVLAPLLMAVAAIVLVYRYSRADREGRTTPNVFDELLLVNSALVSAVLYLGIALYPHPSILIHEHEFFHYYMGSKYSREVGYLDLYNCAAVADADNAGGRVPPYMIRRMDDYSLVPSREVLLRGDRYRALFSEDRWEEFRADVAVFRSAIGEDWDAVFLDHGYHATPVWNMVARAISNRVSVQWPIGMLLLAALDIVLLGLAFATVWRTFGRRTALMAIIFLGTLFVMTDATIRGAFLRLDWLAFLVMATCALKSQRYKTAGALVACAGMTRIFPLLFVFGLGAKGLWDFAAKRRVGRRYLEFFAAFALALAVLFALSVAGDGGLESWRAFASKIRFHDSQMASLRLGFKPLLLAGAAPFLGGWPGDVAGRVALFGEIRGIWWAVQALMLTGSFFAVRRLEDYETLPYGYGIFFFLTAATYYYHVALLVLALLFLPKLDERPRAHGMAGLYGISIVGYLLWTLDNLALGVTAPEWARIDSTIALALSGMLFVAVLYVVGFSLYAAHGARRRCERSAPPTRTSA
jgi:hypothetical protein